MNSGVSLQSLITCLLDILQVTGLVSVSHYHSWFTWFIAVNQYLYTMDPVTSCGRAILIVIHWHIAWNMQNGNTSEVEKHQKCGAAMSYLGYLMESEPDLEPLGIQILPILVGNVRYVSPCTGEIRACTF